MNTGTDSLEVKSPTVLIEDTPAQVQPSDGADVYGWNRQTNKQRKRIIRKHSIVRPSPRVSRDVLEYYGKRAPGWSLDLLGRNLNKAIKAGRRHRRAFEFWRAETGGSIPTEEYPDRLEAVRCKQILQVCVGELRRRNIPVTDSVETEHYAPVFPEPSPLAI